MSQRPQRTLGMSVFIPQSELNVVHPHASWRLTELPPFERMLEPRILLTILGYTLLFQLLAFLTKRFLWKSAAGFRQYRLRNLTICCLHSMISGGIVLWVVVTRFPYVFNNPVFYNEAWMEQILLFSVGYFIHDSIHMLQFEVSRWTIELLVHHFITSSVLMIAVVVEKFIGFAYWSLLMECNSVFLHLRTIFQLSGANTRRPQLFAAIKQANIWTFVLFRFVSPFGQMAYVWDNAHHYRHFYFVVGWGTGVVFTLINAFLFVRVLASDGFLGDYGRRHAAIDRDGGELHAAGRPRERQGRLIARTAARERRSQLNSSSPC